MSLPAVLERPTLKMRSVRLKLIYSASFRPRQYVLVLIGVTCSFATVVAALGLLPSPHTRFHYLIAGTIPTCLGLVSARIWLERKRLQFRKFAVRRASAEERS